MCERKVESSRYYLPAGWLAGFGKRRKGERRDGETERLVWLMRIGCYFEDPLLLAEVVGASGEGSFRYLSIWSGERVERG